MREYAALWFQDGLRRVCLWFHDGWLLAYWPCLALGQLCIEQPATGAMPRADFKFWRLFDAAMLHRAWAAWVKGAA